MLPGLRPKVVADLHRERAAIPWVDDEDLRGLERRSPGAALALATFTWGGGFLYAKDRLRGGLGLAALFGWFMAAPRLPPQLFSFGWVGIGALLGTFAFRRVRAMNRFASTRAELTRSAPPNPEHYRLLAAAAAADPTLASALPDLSGASPSRPSDSLAPTDPRVADAIKRLRKLSALSASGVIKPHELQDRKLDVLGKVAPDSKAALDDLLYALLPLLEEGTLTQDDLELVKSLTTGL